MTGTIDGLAIPDEPDLPRMRRDRSQRLQRGIEECGLDGIVLQGTNNVAYATGLNAPGMDSGRATLWRSVAIVRRGDPTPHLFTPFPDDAPDDLPADHLHGPLWPEVDDGADLISAAAELLGPSPYVAADELPTPSASGWVSAAAVLSAAKLAKTPDELACIRAAQRINELAMREVQPMLRPGIRQSELSGAFLRRVFELGATSNSIDPIWQAMPASRTEGPWTTNGDIAFPTASTDRFLRSGEVVWVDTGIAYEGYASDFGRTWLVGRQARPTARQRRQFETWQRVVDAVLAAARPGATGRDLTRAAELAAGGQRRPWLEHFYLAHGVGTDSAEPPLIGTDLGDDFDDALVLVPGMVLVIEPVIWDDGASGYRSEDSYAVTDDGWVCLSDYPYTPFGPAA